MNGKTKIRLDSIEKAQRTLEGLPEHSPEELTKTQAIQRLIGPICATQSKGYSLAAISVMLSQCGIPITTGALRAYVSEANAAADGKKKPKGKRAAKTSKARPPGVVKGSQSVAAAEPAVPAAKPTLAGPTRTDDLDWEPAAGTNQAAPARPAASRSSFDARPDAKDR